MSLLLSHMKDNSIIDRLSDQLSPFILSESTRRTIALALYLLISRLTCTSITMGEEMTELAPSKLPSMPTRLTWSMSAIVSRVVTVHLLTRLKGRSSSTQSLLVEVACILSEAWFFIVPSCRGVLLSDRLLAPKRVSLQCNDNQISTPSNLMRLVGFSLLVRAGILLSNLATSHSPSSLLLKEGEHPSSHETTLFDKRTAKSRLRIVANDDSECMQCSICISPCVDPTSTTCGHVFCWECIGEWCTSSHEPQCPTCRSACDIRALLRLFHYSPALSIKTSPPFWKRMLIAPGVK